MLRLTNHARNRCKPTAFGCGLSEDEVARVEIPSEHWNKKVAKLVAHKNGADIYVIAKRGVAITVERHCRRGRIEQLNVDLVLN